MTLQTPRRQRRFAATALVVALAAGCGADESQAVDDHTPVSYGVMVDGAAVSSPYTLIEDQTGRVRLTFLNAAGEDLDELEASHFAGLAFEPTTLATATRVSGHNYEFDVTGGAPGTGTLRVSFGHDEAADETMLSTSPLTVAPAP